MAQQSVTYHAVFFDDVGSAIQYANALLPFLVARDLHTDYEQGRPAVWFHVPGRCTGSTREGCYLFLSEGALAATREAALETVLSGSVSRAGIPKTAVLLFGEDETRVTPRGPRRYGRGARPAAGSSSRSEPARDSRPVGKPTPVRF